MRPERSVYATMRALFLVLLPVACSHDAAGPCRLVSLADLPVALDHNRLDVNGRVNRSDAKLVIDTGAERTVLTTQAVRAFLLASSQLSATQLTGVGGSVSNADAYADLELGGANFGQRLAVADIAGIVGLIGGDMLSDYDVEVDLPDGRFRLWHASGGCGAGDLPWNGPRSTIPIRVTGGEQVRVPVMINGKTADALLDSGTSISLLKTDAAQRLGVTQAELAADPDVLVRGIDGNAIRVRIHRLGSLSVGGDRFIAPELGVGEVQLGSHDMLLGLDYLRSRRVWVSYRSEQMFVQ
jgi:predicted aspartyl protease